jgi:hypothetical protein
VRQPSPGPASWPPRCQQRPLLPQQQINHQSHMNFSGDQNCQNRRWRRWSQLWVARLVREGGLRLPFRARRAAAVFVALTTTGRGRFIGNAMLAEAGAPR